uniref:Lipoprotein n=1 Tax=viral metagenome TaxID=1070528 RepID=A0A6M3ITU8_9ZZZZ
MLTKIISAALAITLWAASGCLAQGSRVDSLENNVLIRLGYVPNDTSRYQGYALIEYLNEAQTRVAIDAGAYRKLDSVNTVAGWCIYSAPSDAIEGWPIQVLSYEETRKESQWVGLAFKLFPWFTSGEKYEREVMGYVHAGKFVIYPPPAKTGSKLYIFYRAQPTALTTINSLTVIPRIDRPAMIHYAAYLAAAEDWPEKAALELAEYNRHIQERKRDQAGLWFTPPPIPPEVGQ